eukprot:CAMPEP_0181429792 /NCGR_PEP_ID=MMETSP1110-20121109/17385_1 /TAXON_ID=174948 /ORGANISM="Symbiodinium sp., Strain CCMP421" /LENGTH=212 /DNA_ID=CAMNT_0023553077 /DNA_START=145 /DNA_END=783 /DNA_ORIENTATION=+
MVRCLMFILAACDAVIHARQDLYLQIEGSLAEKVCLATLGLMGATFTAFAIYGVVARMTQAVRLAWYFFVFQFCLDICGVLWETLLHAGCEDIPDNLASDAARPFACGVERALWLSFFSLVIIIEGYALFILHCYCEDVVVSVPTKAFEDLYTKSETRILAKHLNPYNHLYGALPGHNEIAGEAVMAGVPMGGTYRLFDGTFHDMSWPPGSS